MVSDTEINESTVDNAEPKNDYKKFLLFDDLQEATSESDPDFVLSDDYETISDSSDSQSEVEDLIKDLKKDLKIQGGAELNQEIEKGMENHNKYGRENYLEENSPPSSEFEFVDNSANGHHGSGGHGHGHGHHSSSSGGGHSKKSKSSASNSHGGSHGSSPHVANNTSQTLGPTTTVSQQCFVCAAPVKLGKLGINKYFCDKCDHRFTTPVTNNAPSMSNLLSNVQGRNFVSPHSATHHSTPQPQTYRCLQCSFFTDDSNAMIGHHLHAHSSYPMPMPNM